MHAPFVSLKNVIVMLVFVLPSTELIIGFQESDYTATEDSIKVHVCAVVVNGSIAENFGTVEVNVLAAGGTATRKNVNIVVLVDCVSSTVINFLSASVYVSYSKINLNPHPHTHMHTHIATFTQASKGFRY